MHENLRPDPLGDLQRSPDPVAGGKEPAALYPRTLPPLSASWASDFGPSPLTQNRKLGPSQHDGLGPCMFFWGEEGHVPDVYGSSGTSRMQENLLAAWVPPGPRWEELTALPDIL